MTDCLSVLSSSCVCVVFVVSLLLAVLSFCLFVCQCVHVFVCMSVCSSPACGNLSVQLSVYDQLYLRGSICFTVTSVLCDAYIGVLGSLRLFVYFPMSNLAETLGFFGKSARKLLFFSVLGGVCSIENRLRKPTARSILRKRGLPQFPAINRIKVNN